MSAPGSVPPASQYAHSEVLALVELALREDIGAGDVTSAACVPANRMAMGRYYAREEVLVAGIELIPIIFQMRGGADDVQLFAASGGVARPGQMVASVHGPARLLLECERVTLNFLQRLSGVATNARRYIEAVAGTGCRVLDTRKTTPGLRRLEKLAAAAGGVTNHRMGLYDAVLIKNNHIAAAGGIRAALERARLAGLPIEIEVRTRAEIDQAIANGAKHLLLDNFSPGEAREEIRRIAGRATVELSGKIDLSNVRAYAGTGADYVSCGAITHSVRAADFNFRIELA